MKQIAVEFEIGQIVYYKLDKEQDPMIITSIWIQDNYINYECRDTGKGKSYFNEFELTKEQNILTKIS